MPTPTHDQLTALVDNPPPYVPDPETGWVVSMYRSASYGWVIRVVSTRYRRQVDVYYAWTDDVRARISTDDYSTQRLPAGATPLPREFWPDDLKRVYLRAVFDGSTRTLHALDKARLARYPRASRLHTWWIPRFRRTRADLTALVRQAVADGVYTSEDTAMEIVSCLNVLSIERTTDAVRERLDSAGVDDDLLPTTYDCGHVGLSGSEHTVGGFARLPESTCCDRCFDAEAVHIPEYGGYAWRDDVYWWESDEEYHVDEEPEPEPEPEEDDDGGLMSYDADALDYLSIDGSFESTAHGDFHMGVELETVCKYYDAVGGKVEEMQYDLGRDYAIYKRDGSIGAAGIEIVTRPTSLAKHLAKLGEWHVPQGIKAWDAGCCGMHVHIDSRAFTALTLGRLITFFNDERNAGFIRQIAGRHPAKDTQADSYAGFDTRDKNGMRILDVDPIKALKNKPSSRYVMVNTTNLNRREQERLGLEVAAGPRGANTVELRIFRASLRKERLLSQLEFSHALVVFCRTASNLELNGSAFVSWLRKHAGAYRNLAKWYGINQRHGAPKQPAPRVGVEPERESDALAAA